MTRARKTTTLSVKVDFDRLISGDVDTGISHVTPSPQSLVTPTVFSQTSTSSKTRKASSSFHHRLFSRSSATPGQREEENDPSEGPQDVTSETTPSTPRKTMMMTGWPFSRSALRKNSRPTEDSGDITTTAGTSRLTPQNVKDPGSGIRISSHSSSPYYSVTSFAPTSTSSLGSLVPTHECLFHVVSRDLTDEQTSTCHQCSDSSRISTYAPPSRVAITTPSDPILPDDDNGASGARGNHRMVERHLHQDQASGASEPSTWTSSFELATKEETYSRRSVAATTESESQMSDEDPTPRTETFNPMVTMSPPALVATRMRGRRVQCLNIDVLALRPAVGVTPHAPSETESFSTSASSVTASSPPTSPITRHLFPAAFPAMKPSSDIDAGTFSSPPRVLPSTTPPNPRIVAVSPDNGSSRSNSNCSPDGVTMASSASIGASPRSRKRAISRSLTPPPLPRPPPKGPLPAVPSSLVPPVPPLPPLLNKFSMLNVNVSPRTMIPSPPRSSIINGAATMPANAGTAALPPSSPGALRLPSRLSWINSVRAVLPSPPASPTKKAKTLSGGDKPSSSSQAEKKQSGELERRPRPTSVGIIEATEDLNGDNEVRRTKSILLLGSRSKSNMSLGTKRVQIHADVNGDSDVGGNGVSVGAPSASTAAEAPVLALAPASTSLRKQKRKSSSALGLGLGLGRPTAFSSGPYPRVPSLPIPMPTANSRRKEVVVFPLERRHSAPLLSSLESRRSADWTLSLPFSTDVPGNKILLSSSSEPQLKSLEKEEDDWTLCMPLKLRTVDVPVHKLCDGEERVSVDTAEVVTEEEDSEERTAMQLPTPSPSPTCSTPRSGVVPLDLAEDEEQDNEDKEEEEEEEETEERRSVLSVVDPEDRPASALGPHVGGLDLAGGRGKRASGWHVYGWFDEVNVDEDVAGPVVAAVPEGRFIKSHISAFRTNVSSSGSIVSSATSTLDTVFYSARSSWLVN